MFLRSVTALVLLTAAAQAEDRAALMARAPAIPLDGAVTPLAAPVDVGGAGWGPFRRLCVAKSLLHPSSGQEVPASPPNCIEVVEARREGEVWHLAFRTDPVRGGARVDFATTRDAAGRVGEAEIAVPQGVPPPPAEVMTRLRTIFRAAIEAHGLERLTVAPDASFLMPLPVDVVNPGMQVEGGGLVCRAEGEAAVGGRRVVVAACGARGGGEESPGRAIAIDIAGRFAIDAETGLVLRHGYASFLAMDADPRGGMGRMEMRGASRQTLE